MSTTVKGIPASTGLSIGSVWVFKPAKIDIKTLENCDAQKEWQRLQDALQRSHEQLESLSRHTLDSIGKEEADIFKAHQLILADPDMLQLIRSILDSRRINAEAAVEEGIEKYAGQLLSLQDEYFRARAQDVRDIGLRIQKNLMGIALDDVRFSDSPAILIAEDLAPSDTVQFDRDKILGFCIQRGGPTSHTAILARSLGVPAVVNASVDLSIKNGTMAILDGSKGMLVIDPDKKELEEARRSQQSQNQEFDEMLKRANEPAITLDNFHAEVVANIGGKEDALQAVKHGAEGVGLLRTEFLYLQRKEMPTEEEQIKAYRSIFEVMGKRPVIVRTMDIGGDKQVDYLGIKAEPNPFLGWRAIRMINEKPEILKDQFRAILQAGAGYNVRIMLPMVSCIEEVQHARALYQEACQELASQGKSVAENVHFGIMVEVPSTVFIIKALAEYVDFFSIGTNDLTQYTIAVDRTNEQVAHLASYFHPAVLHLIRKTIRDAHAKHKYVGLCGEMAGDPLATPFLLGAGLDEFSMAARSIPKIKHIIRQYSVQNCTKIVDRAVMLPSAAAVEKYFKGLADRSVSA